MEKKVIIINADIGAPLDVTIKIAGKDCTTSTNTMLSHNEARNLYNELHKLYGSDDKDEQIRLLKECIEKHKRCTAKCHDYIIV